MADDLVVVAVDPRCGEVFLFCEDDRNREWFQGMLGRPSVCRGVGGGGLRFEEWERGKAAESQARWELWKRADEARKCEAIVRAMG